LKTNFLGGCDSTIKTAEETDLPKTIKQCTIHNKDGEEEDPFKIIDLMISRNTVAIFTKSFCPHCKRLKEYFTDKRVAFKTLDLDLMGMQGAEIQAILKERTGQSSVPNVWVLRKFIGKNLKNKIIWIMNYFKELFNAESLWSNF